MRAIPLTPANDPEFKRAEDGLLRPDRLLVTLALQFIEQHSLLDASHTAEAGAGMEAMFLHTSGEEAALRKLIRILKTQKALDQTFGEFHKILSGIDRSVGTLKKRIAVFRERLKPYGVSVEENQDFVGPFLEYGHQFLSSVQEFERLMQRFHEASEEEARWNNLFRIAREAREHLKRRLAGKIAPEENKDHLTSRFLGQYSFEETESNRDSARRRTAAVRAELRRVIANMREMCIFAQAPAARAPSPVLVFRQSLYDDVHARWLQARAAHPRLAQLADDVEALLHLFHHADGMFIADYERFERVIAPMMENTEAYFEARSEDRELQQKQQRLARLEALIDFLEAAARLLDEPSFSDYGSFSRAVTETLSEEKSTWLAYQDELLDAKVNAESALGIYLGN
jgi:hypothetical protein